MQAAALYVAKYYNCSARDFTTQLERYDVIFDAVGKSSFVFSGRTSCLADFS